MGFDIPPKPIIPGLPKAPATLYIKHPNDSTREEFKLPYVRGLWSVPDSRNVDFAEIPQADFNAFNTKHTASDPACSHQLQLLLESELWHLRMNHAHPLKLAKLSRRWHRSGAMASSILFQMCVLHVTPAKTPMLSVAMRHLHLHLTQRACGMLTSWIWELRTYLLQVTGTFLFSRLQNLDLLSSSYTRLRTPLGCCSACNYSCRSQTDHTSFRRRWRIFH
jgi:hypothetical protein